mmetsp:Transcript_23325/g.51529  ORF Transcript_23325/g.51529 Transcript_23325/m.51529 type:complete len:258 (-) Transcript_23325:3-776(-)
MHDPLNPCTQLPGTDKGVLAPVVLAPALALTQTTSELALEGAALVGVEERAFPLGNVICEFAVVCAAIPQPQGPEAMPHVVGPAAYVLPAVAAAENPLALPPVFDPAALVGRAVSIAHLALAMSQVRLPLPCVRGAVAVGELSLTVATAVVPATLVFLVTHVVVIAAAFHAPLDELALVASALMGVVGAITMALPSLEEAFVPVASGILLLAEAVQQRHHSKEAWPCAESSLLQVAVRRPLRLPMLGADDTKLRRAA